MFAKKENERYFKIAFVFLFVLLVAIDQALKNNASNIFKNYNFAFSLPLPLWLIYIIYLLVISGVIMYFFKNSRHLNQVSLLAFTLIFAGAFSNIGERIIYGYVRDFFQISLGKWTGVYNLADGYIILGIILLLIFYPVKTNTETI